MNATIARIFREFILGNSLNFKYNDSLIANFKNQLASSLRFDILVAVAFLISFFCVFFVIFMFTSRSRLFKSYVIAIIIVYCFFCIQKCYLIINKLDKNANTTKSNNQQVKPKRYSSSTNSSHARSYLMKPKKEIHSTKAKLNRSNKNLAKSKDQNVNSDAHDLQKKPFDNKNDANTVKDRKDTYMNKLKEQMSKKQETDEEYKVFVENILKTKDKVDKNFKALKVAYTDFSSSGKKIKNELLAIDISIELYDYEFKRLEEEISKIYDISFVKDNKEDMETRDRLKEQSTKKDLLVKDIVCPDVKSENDISNLKTNKKDIKIAYGTSDHKQYRFLDVLRNYNSFFGKSDMNDAYNFFRDINDEKIDEKINNENGKNTLFAVKNVKNIRLMMFIECAFAFGVLLFLICGFDILGFFRLVLLLLLITNVVYALFTMIIAEVLHKKCLLNETSLCGIENKTSFDDFIYEIMNQLNPTIDIENKALPAAITNEYMEMHKAFDIKQKEIQDYLKHITEIKIQKHLELLKSLYKKLMFIESNFDDLMSKKVDKDLFYDNIKTIMDETYKIEDNMKNNKVDSAITLLQKYTELAWFTKTEAEEFENNLKTFVIENENKTKNDQEKKCKHSVETICSLYKDHDVLYFTMLVFGLVFMVFIAA